MVGEGEARAISPPFTTGVNMDRTTILIAATLIALGLILSNGFYKPVAGPLFGATNIWTGTTCVRVGDVARCL
jgi:hypothetical protein